jgi:mevalonate kinase
MSSASAPGKVILFGEHAVVYGQPALAIPVSQVKVTVSIKVFEDNSNPPTHRQSFPFDWKERIKITAPSIGRFGSLAAYSSTQKLDPLSHVIENTFTALAINNPPSLDISINSTIPVASGLGSGAAVSVALVRALSFTLGKSISDEQVNLIAYETEKLYHGTPSGIDNTVITYDRPVYFIKNSPIQTFNVGAPFTLIIADSGVKAATHESVGDVRTLWLADPLRLEKIFTSIGSIVEKARNAIQSGNWVALGPLMDQNHHLLQQLTVSSPILDHLVVTALSSGALGAKLSGGGRGGNIIALVRQETAETIACALKSAGASDVIITTVV